MSVGQSQREPPEYDVYDPAQAAQGAAREEEPYIGGIFVYAPGQDPEGGCIFHPEAEVSLLAESAGPRRPAASSAPGLAQGGE